MWRVLCAGAIGITMLAERPVFAQGPKSTDSVQKLQAELEALKMRIKDVEARLEKVRSESEKKPGFGKGKGKGKGDFGPPGKGKGKGPGYGKGPWSKPGEFGKPDFGRRGYGNGYRAGEYGWGRWRKPGEFGRGGYRPPDRREDPRDVSNAEILRTLQQVLREIEDLRRLIRRR